MRTAAILDIGSSKIVCLCGSPVNRDGIAVHGVAVVQYPGYRGGEFLDKDALHTSIIEAVQAAEQQSRMRIRELAVAVPTPFVRLITTEARIPIPAKNRRVTAEDVDALITESLKHARAPGYVLMHSTPVSFMAGGEVFAEIPEGVRATEISGLCSHMYVREDFVELVEASLADIHVEISMCVSAQLAETLLIIPEAERVRPAVLIDVGYAHTDIAIVENAALTSTATIEIGGLHLTSDLSFGLDVPMEAAEQVKRRYVFGQEALSSTEIIRMPMGIKRVEHSVVELIVQARADELSELIKTCVKRMGVTAESFPVTYLTGGGLCMMKGACEYLKGALRLPVKRDMPYMPDMNSPNYTSAFGALDFVLRASAEEIAPEPEQRPSILDRIRDLLIK